MIHFKCIIFLPTLTCKLAKEYEITQHRTITSILKQTSLRQFETFFLVSCRLAGAILTTVLIPPSQTHSSKLEVFSLNEFYVFYFAIVSVTCHFQKLRDSNNQSSSNLGLGGWMGGNHCRICEMDGSDSFSSWILCKLRQSTSIVKFAPVLCTKTKMFHHGQLQQTI